MLKMALLGSFHQGHSQYGGAGRQCACTSLSAMMHTYEKNPKIWEKCDMDSILIEGDKQFTSIHNKLPTALQSKNLLISDLPVNSVYNTMKILQSYSGTLDRKITEMPFMSLEDALRNTNTFCFITLGCYTMALLKPENVFYMYDSHSRNEFGMSSADGTSVMTSHLDLQSCCLFIRHLASTILPKETAWVFEVNHVGLCKELEEDDELSEFEGFSEMSEGDYICCMQILQDDLKLKVDQINAENYSDTDLSPFENTDSYDESEILKLNTESDDESEILKLNTESADDENEILNENTYQSKHTSEPEEMYTAQRVDNTNFTSNDFLDTEMCSEPEPKLNDSFVERVLFEGLMNESHISLDLLEGSDEDDVPLNLLSEKLNAKKELLSMSTSDSQCSGDISQNQHNYTIINDKDTNNTETINNQQNAKDVSKEDDETEQNIQKNTQIFEENTEESADELLTESDDKEERGRKRSRNEYNWKRNEAKRRRNFGQEYTSLQNKSKRARLMKKGCNLGCRYKCHEKITEEQRQKIFHEYWNVGDINRQRDYISCRVHATIKKSKCNTASSVSRQFSRRWQFKVDGQYVNVCKTFFLHTLDISHTVVDTALRKSISKENVSGIGSPDKRGKHTNRFNKIPVTQLVQVKNHINSFARIDSHYCRKDSSKSYLEPGLTVPKMYNMYLEHCTQNGFLPVSSYSYRYIFDTKFNISFHKPMKDICDYCSKYRNASESEKIEMQSDYESHIRCKEWVREMKASDKVKAKDNSKLSVACFDLQQVLETPHSNESCMYYTRKLCTFNPTVYDLGTTDGYAYIWNEAIAGRGSCEIASCVYKFLEQQYFKGKSEVILYSDNCGGQNRNKNFVAMLSHAKSKFQFKKIQQKFLERGHTQNENDSMHAAIENKSRHVSIYTTPQWAATVRVSRSSPYQVKELHSEDFSDYKLLADDVPNFVYDTQGQKIKWLKTKVITLDNDNSKIVSFLYSDLTSSTINLGVRHNSTRAAKSQKVYVFPTCQPLYKNKDLPKLSSQKYKALKQLCSSNIIPRIHHDFYYSLRHTSDDESN